MRAPPRPAGPLDSPLIAAWPSGGPRLLAGHRRLGLAAAFALVAHLGGGLLLGVTPATPGVSAPGRPGPVEVRLAAVLADRLVPAPVPDPAPLPAALPAPAPASDLAPLPAALPAPAPASDPASLPAALPEPRASGDPAPETGSRFAGPASRPGGVARRAHRATPPGPAGGSGARASVPAGRTDGPPAEEGAGASPPGPGAVASAPAPSTGVAALVRVPPVYPPGARRAGIEGTVTVELAVRPDGSVGEVRVIDASPAGVFEGAVLRALRQWRFGAAGGEGDPALRHARQVVRFSLRS